MKINYHQQADLGLFTAELHDLMSSVLEVAVAQVFVIQLQSRCSQQGAAESEAIGGLS